jgi:hypothetical protein
VFVYALTRHFRFGLRISAASYTATYPVLETKFFVVSIAHHETRSPESRCDRHFDVHYSRLPLQQGFEPAKPIDSMLWAWAIPRSPQVRSNASFYEIKTAIFENPETGVDGACGFIRDVADSGTRAAVEDP